MYGVIYRHVGFGFGVGCNYAHIQLVNASLSITFGKGQVWLRITNPCQKAISRGAQRLVTMGAYWVNNHICFTWYVGKGVSISKGVIGFC